MKKYTNNTVLDELKQVLSLEESILGTLTPEIAAESSEVAESAEKDEKKLYSNQKIAHNDILLGIITDQARTKLVWQGVAACLVLFAVIVSIICFGLYISRGNLAEKVAEIKPLEKKLADSKAEVDSVKAQAVTSSAELKRSQSELDNAKAEIKTLREQLAVVTQSLETLRSRNAEAVKLLNGRLQRLSSPSPGNQKQSKPDDSDE
jgi:DNA repair exonuclease SbcCD ATPase subunit